MAWVAPRTWVTGEILSSANLNTHVRDNTQWLHDRSQGHALDVVESYGSVGIGGTTPSSATQIIASNAMSLDGSIENIVEVMFSCVWMACNTNGNAIQLQLELFDNGSPIGTLWRNDTGQVEGVTCFRRWLPAAGVHTFAVRGWFTGGAGQSWSVWGGPGGSSGGSFMPMTLITRISG